MLNYFPIQGFSMVSLTIESIIPQEGTEEVDECAAEGLIDKRAPARPPSLHYHQLTHVLH